jgi:hypothetical protein
MNVLDGLGEFKQLDDILVESDSSASSDEADLFDTGSAASSQSASAMEVDADFSVSDFRSSSSKQIARKKSTLWKIPQ